MSDTPVSTGMGTTQPELAPGPPPAPPPKERQEGLAMWLQFARRALFLVIALFLAWGFIFLLANATADPLAMYSGGRPIPSQARERLIRELGLDQPLVLRYFRWLGGVLTGDLGTASMQRQPVADMIADYLPNTLLLGGAGLALALPLAAAGIGLALLFHRLEGRGGPLGSVLKGLGRLFVFPGAAIPAFGLGLLLVLVFGIWLKWLPLAGKYSAGAQGDLGDLLRHLILPALALAPLPATLVAQAVAREVTLPRAQGGWRVWVGGLLRGLGTLFSLAGLWLSLLVLVEMVFGWPGIGRLMATAATTRDMALLLGLLVVCSLLVLAGRLLAELFRWLERIVRVPPLSPPPEPTPWRKKARRLYVIIALALLALPLLLSVAGLAVGPATDVDFVARREQPSAAHLLGTDELGRDVLARTVRGSFTSVGMAMLVAAGLLVPAALGGVLTGWLAGRRTFWRESLADLVLLPADALLLIPALPAALFLMSILGIALGHSWLLTLLVVAIVLLPRAVRAGQALWLAAPEPRRLLLLILGGGGALLLGTLYAAFALQAGMDFLGVGVPPPTPSLGEILGTARLYIRMNPGSVVGSVLILGFCAAIFYTAADALVGYFQDKGVMARLSE